MKTDVLVIGGGMAGATAALRAAALGADVTLIRKGHGVSAMSSGTIDVAGPSGFLPYDAWDSLPSIPDRLGEILRTRPLHPYSIIAGGRNELEALHAHLQRACDFMVESIPGPSFRGSLDRNLALASVFGTVKFCAFAPASLVGGSLPDMHEEHLLLVGIRGFPTFHPETCHTALERYSCLHPPTAISQIDVIELDPPDAPGSQSRSPFEVAKKLDDPAVAEQFLKTLVGKVPPTVGRIAFPPVIGLRNHARIYELFTRELPATVFELISPNFSVPGHRLHLSLEAALHAGRVRTITAEVVSAATNLTTVDHLVIEDMKSRRTITAGTYILATGKFGSGGLVADDFPKEPLFDLPLFFDGERVDDRFFQDLVVSTVTDNQPFLSCGIHIDNSLRPLDFLGEPIYDNLLAAGSVIGEYDFTADKCGLGVAVLTGYLAGEKAAG
jgi:glycerol-3-phosphate dehydrogenase subunit B